MMNTLEIGRNVFRLRKDKGITQEELSKVVGVSVAAVSKWEGGASYPDITLLPVIAHFFNVSIDELMSYKHDISDEDIEEIGAKCMEAFKTESEENALSLCNKYIRKYTKSYKLKSFLGTIIMMQSANIKDKEKQKRNYVKALTIYEDIINNSNDADLIKSSIMVIGNINAVLEDYDKALEIYSKVQKDEMCVDNMIGDIYIKKGEVKKGREIIQTSLLRNISNIEVAIASLSNSYKTEDMERAKKYLKLRRNLMDVLDRDVNFADYMFELDLLMEGGTEEEQAICLKNTLLSVEALNFEALVDMQKKWYCDEIEIKKQNSNFIKKFGFKKIMISSIRNENKYEDLLKRKDIAEILDRIG
ncbi:MAG: helix-turn-helix domain-containing protein [Sarcina sp.]